MKQLFIICVENLHKSSRFFCLFAVVLMNSDIFYIDETVRKDALKEHEKTEESVEEDVKTIQIWMKTQRHLPEIMGKFYLK